MRFILPTLLITAMAAVPMMAQDLTITLNSNSGTGMALSIAPDGGPPCLDPNCVLFSGTIADNDIDGSYILTGPDGYGLSDIALTFVSGPANGGLTLDNTWDDLADAGVLIGDPNAATDGAGAPNAYTGPLFGIDIAPGTTVGEYTENVTIEAQQVDANFDQIGNPFPVSAEIMVDVVTPEPATWQFAMAGLAALGACYGLRRKWHFSAASR